MKRRDFLKLAGASGLAFATPLSLFGETKDLNYKGPLFAIFNAEGGWDPTYLMDPKGNDLNEGYTKSQILSSGNLSYPPSSPTQGLSNQAFFEAHGKDILVVNGIDMSINNHAPNKRYATTGKLNSFDFPTFPALAAAALAPDIPIPFLTFGNYSGTGNLVASTQISNFYGIKDLSDVDKDWAHPSTFSHIESALEEVAQEPNQLPKIKRAKSTIFGAQLSSKALSRIVPFLPEEVQQNGFDQVDIALASFASGLGVSANLSRSGFYSLDFDSHDENDKNQIPCIAGLLAMVDYMITEAKKLGLSDRLYIIIQSEMGRTPYNDTKGKDHWPITSAMFMGPKITGNRVVGVSDDKQEAVSINPKSLELDDKGIHIRPEHLSDMLRQVAGIRDMPASKKFDLKVPESERLEGLWG